METGLVDRAAPGEGLRYRHALTREAVLAAPLPHQRVATARAALGRLEAADSSAPVVEAIAALAREADDPHRLARALLQAGEAATQRGALITARERLEASIDAARDIDDDLAIRCDERAPDGAVAVGGVRGGQRDRGGPARPPGGVRRQLAYGGGPPRDGPGGRERTTLRRSGDAPGPRGGG